MEANCGGEANMTKSRLLSFGDRVERFLAELNVVTQDIIKKTKESDMGVVVVKGV